MVSQEIAAGVAVVVAAIGWTQAGNFGAVAGLIVVIGLWYQFLRDDDKKVTPTPSPPRPRVVVPPAPIETGGTMEQFMAFVITITNNQGGGSSRSITEAIATLADHKGLWNYELEGFEQSNITATSLAKFCRLKPSQSTLQDIPGVGDTFAERFKKAGYPNIETLLHKFCDIAGIGRTYSNRPLAIVLDDYFDWVSSVHPGTTPNFHTVVHCTAALADAIDLIDLRDLNGVRDGDKYKESVSACTAESIRDFLALFDEGRGEAGPVDDIKGVGPKAQKAFKKEKPPIITVEDLLDKFASFLN